jgi:hypothetical protein
MVAIGTVSVVDFSCGSSILTLLLVLWSSQHAQTWQVLILVVFFFGFVWGLILCKSDCSAIYIAIPGANIGLVILSRLSKSHSWILPVFAIGLGKTFNSRYVFHANKPLQELRVGRKYGGVPPTLVYIFRGLVPMSPAHSYHEVCGFGWVSLMPCRESGLA